MKTFIPILTIIILFFGSFNAYSQLSERQIKKMLKNGDRLIKEERFQHAIPTYKQLISAFPENSLYQYKLGFCYLNTLYMKQKSTLYLENAIKYLTEEDKKNNAPDDVYYYLIKSLRANNEFELAIETFEKYAVKLERNKKLMPHVEMELSMCRNGIELAQYPVNMIVTNLGSKINTEFPEHSPVISADESVMIFTSPRDDGIGSEQVTDAEYFEDLYISYKDSAGWTKPENMGNSINTREHEASIGLSADGQKLFIYKSDRGDGNVYMSTLIGDIWSRPQKLGSNINTKARETHASLSADENSLYFTSDRRGGYGGLDIYVSHKLPTGEWGLAQNLGTNINTPEDEEGPYIHPDGVTIYFSSKGHKTIGGFDVFQSTLNETGFWGEPVNLGYPINTTDDDVFYTLTPDGKRAYYSSRKGRSYGKTDIYMAKLPEFKEKLITIVKGFVVYEWGNLNDVKINVVNEITTDTIGIYHPNSKTGKYLFILNRAETYKIEYNDVTNAKVKFERELILPLDTASQIELDTVKLTPKGHLINGIWYDEKITVSNILFPYGKVGQIETNEELDKLAAYLKTNSEAKVEVGAFADASGASPANVRLTKKRAKMIKNYLLSKEVNKKQIVDVGYGEDNPIARNKTKSGAWYYKSMKYNRRVEFSVLIQGGESLYIETRIDMPEEYRLKDEFKKNTVITQ